MSLKVLIPKVYKRLRRVFRARLPVKMAEQSAEPSVHPVKKSNAGRKALKLNVAVMASMRSAGKSDAEIARKFDCSSHTVASRLRDYKAPVAPPPPAHVQQAPDKPPVLPARPVPAPAPVPVTPVEPVPPPAPCGSVPEGTKTFFLVHGNLNQEYAHNYAQPAIGIETWHHDYASLPAFRDAEKIFVVMNSSEDNRTLLMSIVSDIWIREKCLLSVDNGATPCTQPVRFGVWVQYVAKDKLRRDRPHDGSRPQTDMSDFEKVHNFQKIPLPSHKDKLDALLKSPKTDEADRPSSFGGWWGSDDWWRYGGSGAW
jgi:hypothetical protein